MLLLLLLLLLLSRFSRVHRSGLPFPSPMRESEVAQSCPTLCDPMNCSPPGSSIHGIFQARVLEWVAIAFSATLYRQGNKGKFSTSHVKEVQVEFRKPIIGECQA